MLLLTRIGVGPRPSTASQTGRRRYGPASPEPTGRRMSASPCWPSPAHPRRVTQGEGKKNKKTLQGPICMAHKPKRMNRTRTKRPRQSYSQVRGGVRGSGISSQQRNSWLRWKQQFAFPEETTADPLTVCASPQNPNWRSLTGSQSFTTYFPPLTHFSLVRERREGAKRL